MKFTVVHITPPYNFFFLVQNQNTRSPPFTKNPNWIFPKPYPMQRSHFSSNMLTGLDMALDDIINCGKKFNADGGRSYRGRGRGHGLPAADRRFVNRKPFRTTPYPQVIWVSSFLFFWEAYRFWVLEKMALRTVAVETCLLIGALLLGILFIYLFFFPSLFGVPFYWGTKHGPIIQTSKVHCSILILMRQFFWWWAIAADAT